MPFESWLQAGARMLFGFSLGSTAQIVPAVAHLVLSGVFDRIPDLKVVAVEAGVAGRRTSWTGSKRSTRRWAS